MKVTTHTCCLLRPRFAASLPLLRAGRGMVPLRQPL